ncbi:hypothetical protein FO519_006166 [Halicephalobus sp. NKZ332]|nr:hypothetical protein FO519_006166 [Halicephalobus sp. NKZ332]
MMRNQSEADKSKFTVGNINYIALGLAEIANDTTVSKEIIHNSIAIIDYMLFADGAVLDKAEKENRSLSSIRQSYRTFTGFEDADALQYYGENIGTVAKVVNGNMSQLKNFGLTAYKDGFDTDEDESEMILSARLDYSAINCSRIQIFRFTIFRNSKLFETNGTVRRCDNGDHLTSGYAVTGNAYAEDEYGNRTHLAINATENIIFVVFKKEYIPPDYHGSYSFKWWTEDSKIWNNTGCSVSTTTSFIEGRCTHLTDFTLLISGKGGDEIICNKGVSIFGYVTSSLSVISLTILMLFHWTNFTLINESHVGELGCKLSAGFAYSLLLIFILFTLFGSWEKLAGYGEDARRVQILSKLTNNIFQTIFCIVILPLSLLVTNIVVITIFVLYKEVIKKNPSPYLTTYNRPQIPMKLNLIKWFNMQINLGLFWLFQYLAYRYDNLIVFHYLFTGTAGLQGFIMLGCHFCRMWLGKKQREIIVSSRQITPLEENTNLERFLYERRNMNLPRLKIKGR